MITNLSGKIKFSHLYLPLLVLSFTYGCTESRSNKTENKHEIIDIEAQKEEVKATLIAMWDAIEKEDIERYANYVHPNFTQFGETDSVLKIGKEVEVAGIKSWVENSDNIHTEMIDPLVSIKGNIAWISYIWSDNGTTDGKTFASKGKSTRIFIKENEKWLCIHGHYTLL